LGSKRLVFMRDAGENFGKNRELRIAVAPADPGRSSRVRRTDGYEVDQVAPNKLALTAPSRLDERLARREVELYVPMLERLRPDVESRCG
jgi:hypothetical protein